MGLPEKLMSSTRNELISLKYFINNLQNPALLLTNEGEILDGNKKFLDIYQLTKKQIKQNYEILAKVKNLPFTSLSALYNGASVVAVIAADKGKRTFKWVVTTFISTNSSFIVLIGTEVSDLINEHLKTKNFKKLIIDSIPNLYIFWKDINFVFAGCNQALTLALGFKCNEELVGKTDYDLHHNKTECDAYRAIDQEIINTGKPKLKYEEIKTLPSGEQRFYLSNKLPIIDENNKIIGVLGICADITRKKMLMAVQAANKECLVNMHHDLNTPLTGLICMAQLLEKKLTNSEEKQYARWINESGECLADLLNKIFNKFATYNMQEASIENEKFDLRKLIDVLIKLEMPTIKTKNLKLKVTIDKAIPQFVITDRMKLHRILLNLLGNAIKFTEKGYVAVKIKLLSKKVNQINIAFDVIDTGIGIAEKMEDKIYDRYFRIANAETSYSGQGVGLNIVRTYLQLLGGKISLSSKPGQGTTFSFNLPCTIE